MNIFHKQCSFRTIVIALSLDLLMIISEIRFVFKSVDRINLIACLHISSFFQSLFSSVFALCIITDLLDAMESPKHGSGVNMGSALPSLPVHRLYRFAFSSLLNLL